MILKPSPIRKSPASLHAALRALMVSACALTVPTSFAHANASRRPVSHSPWSPTSTPYLALLAPTPMRFATPVRPPAVLALEPLPEEVPTDAPAPDSAAAVAPPSDLIDFNLPTTSELDAAIAQLQQENEAARKATKPAGPPPIMLSDEPIPGARPEDILPFFRLPSLPSSATYKKE